MPLPVSSLDDMLRQGHVMHDGLDAWQILDKHCLADVLKFAHDWSCSRCIMCLICVSLSCISARCLDWQTE